MFVIGQQYFFSLQVFTLYSYTLLFSEPLLRRSNSLHIIFVRVSAKHVLYEWMVKLYKQPRPF